MKNKGKLTEHFKNQQKTYLILTLTRANDFSTNSLTVCVSPVATT